MKLLVQEVYLDGKRGEMRNHIERDEREFKVEGSFLPKLY